MLHLRDIQKMKQTNAFSFNKNNSQFRTTKFDKLKPDQYESIKYNPQKEQYNKFLDMKDVSSRQKKTYKKGFSINGFTFYDKKSPSPVLSIYNYSHKSPTKDFMRTGAFTDRPTLQYQYTQKHNQEKKSNPQLINKTMFYSNFIIGKGGFGKVWKVQMKKTCKIYAMKEMYKTKIIEKKSINSVMNERALLAKLKNPFIVNMSYAFQDRQKLYLVLDFLNGGDLRYHIGKRRRFSESQTKFFIVCMIIGLNYLHSNNIIHRDIKPQNLVLESNGYVRITDLGVSRQWKQQNSNDTSGTPGYMAPEVMCRKNHSYGVDYFAVGVIGYEFMLGRRPYLGKNRKEIRDQILSKQAYIKVEDIPYNWTPEGADFINKLLIRNPHYRLGNNGIQQIKQHPWLKNVDWNKMYKKQVKSPYIPINIQEDYDEYKNQISEDTIVDHPQQNALLLRDRQVQNLFDGYYFDINSNKDKTKSTLYTTNNSVINTIITQHENNYKTFYDMNHRR